ncbi:MAG: carboxypeptidase regulatory-like domain-containing protein, partial [Myxococcaceae bacterium]
IAEAQGFLPAVSDETEAGPKPVDLRLIRPRTLEVNLRVDGKPVDGRVGIEGSHLNRSANAKNGVARFTDLFPREVSVTASFGNRAATPRLVMLQEAVTTLTLDLEAGGNISVTVIDEQGQPVPNPEAALLSSRGEVLAHQKAETGALIQFGPVASGNYSVQAWAEAYEPVSQPVKVAGAEANVELTLVKGVVIRGRVIDEYERPAPGVSVLVQPTGNAVFADKEGRFVAQVPTAGLYTLHAHHSDWGGGEVQVQAPADDVKLPLEPHGGVEVTVTCEGRRVEGAEAVMYVNKNDVYRSDRSSAADGVVVMRGLPPGSYSLIIRHPDYVSPSSQKVQIAEGSTAKASVELQTGASISGDVVDDQGAPVAGAYVVAMPSYRDRPTYSDSAGHFELKALRPESRYTVTAQHAEYDLVDQARAVTPGKDPVKLVMRKRSVFTGRVVDESGAPIKHFRVDDRDVDSPDGHFELPLQSIDKRVIFSVEAAGYEPTTVDKEGSQDLGDITLRKSATLLGSVKDERGQPISDAVVTCDLCDQETMSGPDGKFSLARPLTVQELIVTARKGGLSGNVSVDLGRQLPADVVLKPRTHVTGGVYRADGSPAAGEVVEAMGMENSDAITFVTGKDGRYATDLPAGHYRFAVGDARMYGPESVLLVEIGGQAQALDLGPAPGTSALTFKVNPEGGYALWVVRGDVKVDNPMMLNQSSWAQFVYQPQSEVVTLTGFPPGRYTVIWSSFHLMNGQAPQKQLTVDLPGKNQFDLSVP